MRGPGYYDPGPGHYGNRAGSYGRRDVVLAVDDRALEGAEHGPRCDLAVVDREARHLLLAVVARIHADRLSQAGELHPSLPSSPTSGRRSVRSMSRVSSGSTPSSGPIRGTSRPTIGAAFQAAVRWNELATVPLGSSSIAITT